MTKGKKLSNPFSTGGGGANFESHVQASYVALMLSGGHAPCLPSWPIKVVNLQGKVDGFDTDDLIVCVENSDTKERCKLLGQVKHSITITEGDTTFGEVIQAAWNDFNDPKVFTKKKDIIALITGPLSATDSKAVAGLCNFARATKTDPENFFLNVATANFCSNTTRKKLKVFRYHLQAANNGVAVDDNTVHEFLRHFYYLGYDLGEEEGVNLSLITSHIAQFDAKYARLIWSRILEFTQNMNHHAGHIVMGNIPEDITEFFVKPAAANVIPQLLVTQPTAVTQKTDWSQYQHATELALVALLGSWNEKNDGDVKALTAVLGISHDEWIKKAREILHCPDSPLTLKNGQWKVQDRVDLLNAVGSRVLDQNLESFKALATSILTEHNPSFELPVDERYAASIHGKTLDCTEKLRLGIAEGLALLGNNPTAFSNCSQGNAETTVVLTVREVLSNPDWVLWGSLDRLLPTLAEAAPDEFLQAVETALSQTPCPFDELFSQEGNGVTGRNYLTGLLWALENLAWEEKYLVRVCVILGELASHDPGGQWANRPANSLAVILLPWLPQTLAPVDKRKVAVETLLKEWPEIGWQLVIQLLPSQHQTSSGSHKPKWRKSIPADWEKGVTHQEYWQQSSFYAELAVNTADHNIDKLSELIKHFDNLPQPAFDRLIDELSSPIVTELPEDQRLVMWNHLTKFANKHRRYTDAKWTLPSELVSRIEDVAEKLAPTDPFNLYQPLFSDRDIDLYDESGDWEEQRKKLQNRRDEAIKDVYQKGGIEAVIKFSESVKSIRILGQALASIEDESIDDYLLPGFLDSTNKQHFELIGAYIWRRHFSCGWAWCDAIDMSAWSDEQKGRFLTCLPFNSDSWDRVNKWLGDNEAEYWAHTSANAYDTDDGLDVAVDKLLEHKRPHAAIHCLYKMLHDKHSIGVDQCVRALIAGLSSHESTYAMDSHYIIELIQHLQNTPEVSPDGLFRVEWAYLPLLNRHQGAAPKLLEHRLATDPEFFCEAIRLIYRSKNEDAPEHEPTEDAKAIATNAWRLLRDWQTPPGTQDDESFDGNAFSTWLQRVKEMCEKSGHLEVALITIGESLVHAPADADALWVHHAVANALNDRNAEDMRRGFSTGVRNARGVHWVDPTGKPEYELSSQYEEKAESIENAGYQRFAATLRGISEDYRKEAERVIATHKQGE